MRILFLILLASFTVGAQTRTVTNAELEKYRVERLKAEDDYRKNYARLGKPSPEEIERIKDQRRRDFSLYSERLQTEREANETAIIGRANELRSQIASIDSQIAYLRRLRGTTFSRPVTFWSYGYRRGPSPVSPAPQLPPNLQTVTDISRMYPNSTDIFNRSIGNYRFQDLPPRRLGIGGFVVPVFVSVNGGNEVESRLVYLESVRAGLTGEWRALQEAARRAGVRID